MDLKDLLNKIEKTDSEAAALAKHRWDSIAKPLGSLGTFEAIIMRIAAIQKTADIHISRRELTVFCADNGVVKRGVSQCGSEVTAAVTRALSEGRSTVNRLASCAACRVTAVDMGVIDGGSIPGTVKCRIRNGTADICEGSAMSREECIAAILAGAETVMRSDADIIAVGEMGIGNTTTSAAVNTVLLGKPAEELTGRGAGLSDEGLKRKTECVRLAVKINAPDPKDIIDVIGKVGGLDIAAMCGAFLGAAASGKAALIDGIISSTAALCAALLCPESREYMIASHLSSEPAAGYLLEALGLEACINAGMHLGEGGGAVMLLPLLDMAYNVYSSSQSFERLGIEAYTPQN